MTLVVDASVIAKWFYDEPDTATARLLLGLDRLLIAPAHAPAEVGHVLARRVRDGTLTPEAMADAMSGLSRTVVFVPLPGLYAEASRIAVETGTSFYDALYVAAAEAWKADLIDADTRLLRGLGSTRWAPVLRALAGWSP